MAGHPAHDPSDAGGPVGTRLESVDEIRQSIQARLRPAAGPGSAPAAPPEPETPPYRPTRRPSTAMLTVFDDGRDDGEQIRLRGERFVIGRAEGDLVIPHDGLLSSRHAEIVRLVEQGASSWYLNDLGSTNGTFVRVSKTVMKHGQELLIGGRRFRFETGDLATAAGGADKMGRGTQSWQAPAALAALIDLTVPGEGQRHLLLRSETWIGRDPAGSAVVVKDPYVNPRHAVLRQDRKGRWQLENNRSVNGIWLRVDRIPMETACHFQLGEQRFLLKIL
jgi:pSer/pThr/pTyr-binding forkhead associated (FHA) protein